MKNRLPWLGWSSLLPLAIMVIFSLLALFPLYEGFRWAFYDGYLRLKPSIPLHPKLWVVEIDDSTFEELRLYPLSRDLVARGIEKMAELGVEVILVDSEFVEPSPRVVAESYLQEELPRKFDESFGELKASTVELFLGLIGQSRRLDRVYALQLMRDWPQYLDRVRDGLLQRVRAVAQDNDALLGQALRLHGHAHVTVTPTPVPPTRPLDEETREELLGRIALRRIHLVDADHLIHSTEYVSPTILPILRHARGAGSVEQHVDRDGVRRRIDLLFQWQDRFFSHISLASLLDLLGEPEILLYRDRVELLQAVHPDGEVVDITIPLDEEGRMLIHWPKGRFEETFPRVSFLALLKDEDFLRRLQANLEVMRREEWFYLHEEERDPIEHWNDAEAARVEALTGVEGALRRLREARLRFVESARRFLTSSARGAIQNAYRDLLRRPLLTEAERRDIEANIIFVDEIFDASLNLLALWDGVRARLRGLEGKWVSLGYTGRSTTDVGVNPFDPNYMNVGTMASVVNTVLQKRFLDERPWYWSLVLLLPLLLALPHLVRRLSPARGLLFGVAVVLGPQGVFFAVFALSGIYLDAFYAFATTFTCWLVSYAAHFLRTSREAAWVRDMAGQYVSESVVELLIANPSLLRLGGEKKILTAMFTDVKGFSSISEQLDAQELVELLNEYLTAMSDIILEEMGTIDKYEGDAIIAFFNAPLDVPDHARRACRAALRMKQAEQQLNPSWLQRGMSPQPLFTRIGINTGEMVHGNMGTQRKKNYTIMGNHVNLAARLEGVNKQYETSILISEYTRTLLGEEFLVRPLDRVRVVGISTPLRLFELVDFADQASPETQEKVESFHRGLALFESRKWDQALAFFEEFLRRWRDDGPATTFSKRCQDYLQKPPPKEWDGVWNLSTK